MANKNMFFDYAQQNAAKKAEDKNKSPVQKQYDEHPETWSANSQAAKDRPKEFARAVASVVSSKASSAPASSSRGSGKSYDDTPAIPVSSGRAAIEGPATIQTPELDSFRGNTTGNIMPERNVGGGLTRNQFEQAKATSEAEGNTPGAYLRGLVSQQDNWDAPRGMTEAEQQSFQRGLRTQDTLINLPAIIANFGDQAASSFLHPERQYEASQLDPESVQKAGQTGHVAGMLAGTGITKAGGGYYQTLALLEDQFGVRDPLTKNALEHWDDVEKNFAKETEDWTPEQKEWAGYGIEIARMVPDLALAFMTGGGSEAASIAPRATQLSAKMLNYFTSLAKNPVFYDSAIQTMGFSYKKALEEGASQDKATWFAVLNGLLTGATEVGGTQGVITGGNASKLLSWVLSVPEEMFEENIQGSIEAALDNLVLGKDNKWFSFTDPDAVISQARGKEEAKGAAIISALAGGGSYALNSGINAYNRAANAQTQPAATAENPLTQTILANEQQEAPAQEQVEPPIGQPPAPQEQAPQMQMPAEQEQAKEQAMSSEQVTGYDDLLAEYQYRKKAFDDANKMGDESFPYQEAIQWLTQASQTLDRNRAAYNQALQSLGQQRREAGKTSPQYGQPENFVGNRNYEDVGNIKVKAFQFDHPELHPFYLQIAQDILNDVNMQQATVTTYHTRSGKFYTLPATNPLIQLLQGYGVTKEGTMHALSKIMQDNGKEDAAAKRAEIYLHNALVNGYNKPDGTRVQPNQAYIEALNGIPGAAETLRQRQRDEYELSFAGSGMTTAEIDAEMQKWDAEHPLSTSQNNIQGGGVVLDTEANPAPTAPGPQGPALSNGPADRAPTIPVNQGNINTGNTQSSAPQVVQNNGTTVERVAPAPQNAEGTKLSESVPTVQNSAVTSEEFSKLIDKTVSEGGYRYIPITNDATVQKATERIKYDGWEKARADWTADVRSGKTSAEMMAIGALLYNNAVQAGDMKAAAEIMADYVAVGTNTAQALQARKIIQSMQPEMRLYMIERSVERMVKDLNLPEGVKISDELKEEYSKATTDEERDAVVTKMQKEVADQLPSSFKDKWTALRYVNMLGNFRTQGRNLIGNSSMSLLTSAKNAIKALLEAGASKFSGGKYERTVSIRADKSLVNAAKAYYKANADAINGEGKYSDNRTATGFMKGVEDKRTIFGSGARSEWASNLLSNITGKNVEVKKNILEDYRNATNWAMTAGDAVFIGARFSRTLAGYLQANGIDAATFTGIENGTIQPTSEQRALIDRAINYATQEAQEATFHDDNELSNWISKVGRRPGTPKGIKAISEGIMPFRKSPANVLLRAEEYSPLGIANIIYNEVQRRKGNATASDVINSLAKTLTGTGLFGLGMFLRNRGWLRGREDDEKQENFDKLQGEQDYSLEIPGLGSITLDWLSPTSIPLFLGVQMQDARMELGLDIETVLQTLSGITDPLIQMSMLQGVNDAFDNIKYSNNNLVQLGLSAMVSYLTQGLTNTMLGQIERIGEDRRTTTYTDANTRLGRIAQRTLGKALNKVPIPGVDYNQIEYLDAWGRPDMSESNAFARAFNNLVNPGYVSQDNSTEVDNELQRLYDAGMTNVFPQRIEANDPIPVYDEHGQRTGERRLTADEYVQVQREAGQTKLRMVKDLMASPMYDAMSDDARAKAISSIYEYADYEAKRAVEPSMEDKYSDVAKLSNIPAYFATKDAFSDASSNRWNRDYEELDDIMQTYSTLAPDVKKTLESKVDNIGKVYQAYQNGVNTETWYGVYDGLHDIVPVEGNKTPSPWQEYQYIVQNKPAQADALFESFMNQNTFTRYQVAREQNVDPAFFVDCYTFYTQHNSRKGDFTDWMIANGYNKTQAAYMYEVLHDSMNDLSGVNGRYFG